MALASRKFVAMYLKQVAAFSWMNHLDFLKSEVNLEGDELPGALYRRNGVMANCTIKIVRLWQCNRCWGCPASPGAMEELCCLEKYRKTQRVKASADQVVLFRNVGIFYVCILYIGRCWTLSLLVAKFTKLLPRWHDSSPIASTVNAKTVALSQIVLGRNSSTWNWKYIIFKKFSLYIFSKFCQIPPEFLYGPELMRQSVYIIIWLK